MDAPVDTADGHKNGLGDGHRRPSEDVNARRPTEGEAVMEKEGSAVLLSSPTRSWIHDLNHGSMTFFAVSTGGAVWALG